MTGMSNLFENLPLVHYFSLYSTTNMKGSLTTTMFTSQTSRLLSLMLIFADVAIESKGKWFYGSNDFRWVNYLLSFWLTIRFVKANINVVIYTRQMDPIISFDNFFHTFVRKSVDFNYYTFSIVAKTALNLSPI